MGRNKIYNFTVGADPELFLINTKTGKVVSSIGIIPGKKGNPWRGDDMPSGFGLEIDNILAEFNIPPVSDSGSFVNNIEYMKNYISSFVKEKDKNLDILCEASQEVPEDQLQSPEAKMFGCSVDYNVYTERPNPKPKGNITNLRSAGFHIHFGYPEYNIIDSLTLIKYFDMYIGVPSVLLDTDKKRRKLYGKAGCFRLTGYGFEYRVLSSKMMKTPDLIRKVWSGIERSVSEFNNNGKIYDETVIQDIINNNNTKLAKELIKELNIE